jgi:hypothetical protein
MQAGMMVLFFDSLWLMHRVAWRHFQNHEDDSSSSFRTTFIYTYMANQELAVVVATIINIYSALAGWLAGCDKNDVHMHTCT